MTVKHGKGSGGVSQMMWSASMWSRGQRGEAAMLVAAYQCRPVGLGSYRPSRWRA